MATSINHFRVTGSSEARSCASAMSLLHHLHVAFTLPNSPPRAIKDTTHVPKCLQDFRSFYSFLEHFQSDMYLSRSFFLAILPLFTGAIPHAQPPTSRGISIPISKRANLPLDDPSIFASLVQNPIA